MPDIKVIFAGFFEATIAENSLAEFSTDFTFDNFNPNINLVEDWVMELNCTSDSGDTVNFVTNWINDKKIYNNIPVQIIDRKIGLEIANGHADLTASNATYDFEKGIFNIPFVAINNTFFALAGAFNLRTLSRNDTVADAFKVRTTDLQRVQTVLNSVPDFFGAAITAVVVFIMLKEIANANKELGKALADNATPVSGQIISALKVAFIILYIAVIVFGIVKMLIAISEALFSKPRDYFVINIKTLMTKACGHLGFTFESTLFDGDYSDMDILPATRTQGAVRGNPENNAIPDQTLLQFMEGIGTLFNAKIKVKSGNVVGFENRATFIGDPSDFILDGLKQQGTTRFNFSELPQNINLRFIRDPVEANTFLSIPLLGIDISSEPVNTDGDSITASFSIADIEDDNSPFKADMKVQFPYARGYRKNLQTDTERFFNGLYDLVNQIGQLFGVSNNNKEGKIGDRLGRMVLNYDAIGVDKVFIRDGKFVSKKNFSLLHAETLYNRFYQCENPINNQWQIIEGRADQPICNVNDIASIRINNMVRDPNRRPALLQGNKRDHLGLHTIDYRIKTEPGDTGFIPPEKFTITISSDG